MITNYFESHRGGLELVAGRLVRELVRLKEDTRWLASDVTAPPEDKEIAKRAAIMKLLNFTEDWLGVPFPIPTIGALWQIGHEVKRSDAVLLQDSLYPICVISFLLARFWRKPVVIVQHIGIIHYKSRALRFLMTALNRICAMPMLARAEGVVFISENTKNFFSKVRFTTAPVLIFNGVDTKVFSCAKPQEKYRLRAALNLNPERSVVLFVGRFVEKKGLTVLWHMAKQRPDIQWVFAGWGHLDPGAWGLPNVIVFRDLSNADLVPLYHASDVFVLPSKGEGFPLVIQEALACGLPVVTSAENATADMAVAPLLYPVALDETYPAATASAFCLQIDRLLMDCESESSLPHQRYQFVSSRYSWSVSGAKYLSLIQAAVCDLKRPMHVQSTRPRRL